MSEERIELVPQVASDDDEEDVILDDITEKSTLKNEKRQKVKSTDWRTLCCKTILILLAVIIFLAILFRSWSDYGVYITKHVFPPSVNSISVQCPNNTYYGGFSKQYYNAPTCHFDCYTNDTISYCDEPDHTTMTCVGEKPTNWFLQVSKRNDIIGITWEDALVVNYTKNLNTCVELVIWSI